MKIIAHGVEELNTHLSSAPRFRECDHLFRQLSVHINAGSKAMGRGTKAFKKFSYWEIGSRIRDRHSLRRGNRYRELLVKYTWSWMKTGTKLSVPGRTALDGTLYWLAAERATETRNSCIPKTPGASPFLWKNFWFFEFLKKIFTSKSLGFHCPRGGQSENRCGMAGCDGRKTSHDGLSPTLEANWDGARGEQPLSISCGGVKEASHSTEWKRTSVSTFLLTQKGREGHRS